MTNKPWFPEAGPDRAAFTVFIIGPHFYIWYEACLVLPYYYPEYCTMVYVHYLAAVFIHVNCYWNLHKLVRCKLSGNLEERKRALQSAMSGPFPSDWRYCVDCQDYFPPRSHHCKVCNVCVLKRDHHCWFAGRCIGHSNQR